METDTALATKIVDYLSTVEGVSIEVDKEILVRDIVDIIDFEEWLNNG